MVYDFDTPIERRHTDSLKWDVDDDELPMWVADMDFRVAPEIAAALQARLDQGVFGYSIVPDRWRESVCRWWRVRHDVELQPEWLLFCGGIVPAIGNIIRSLTEVGDNVLVQSPVYNMFFNVIGNNRRTVLESPLVFERGRYAVDFADLEAKIADPKTTLMLLCNPQNPAGIIWSRETLAHIGRLCREHGVVVVADEIHCDLTDPGCAYVPFTSVSDADARNSIACVSPTKTFNIAGVKTAALVVPDADLRARVSNGLDIDELGEPNAFAITAAIAAYDGGAAWLDELRAYIYANKQAVAAFLEREVPQVHLVPSQATYLLWLDCGAVTHDSRDLERFLRQRAGLFISQGRIYGSCGDCFMRMNIACPRSMLDDGLGRLKMGIAAYLSTY